MAWTTVPSLPWLISGLTTGQTVQLRLKAANGVPAGNIATAVKPAPAGSTAPTITSFSPTTGSYGTPVTISGTNLGSPQRLWAGGMEVLGADITVNSAGTQAVFTWPRVGFPGFAIEYQTAQGSATSTQVFSSVWLANTQPAQQLPIALFISGDSLTSRQRYGVTQVWEDILKAQFPTAVLPAGDYPGGAYTNLAGVGQKLGPESESFTALNKQQQNLLTPIASLDASFKHALSFIYEGVNDANQGRSAADIIADHRTFGQRATAAGFRHIIATLPPRAAKDDFTPTMAAEQESRRTTVNNYLLSAQGKAETGAVDIVPLCKNRIIGTLAAAENTTYVFDGLHYTDAGQALLAYAFGESIILGINPPVGALATPLVTTNNATGQLILDQQGEPIANFESFVGTGNPWVVATTNTLNKPNGDDGANTMGFRRAARGWNLVSAPAYNTAFSSSGPVNDVPYITPWTNETSNVTVVAGRLVTDGFTTSSYEDQANSTAILGRSQGYTDYAEWVFGGTEVSQPKGAGFPADEMQEGAYVAGLQDVDVGPGYGGFEAAVYVVNQQAGVFAGGSGTLTPAIGQRIRISVQWGAAGAGNDTLVFSVPETGQTLTFGGKSLPDALFFDCSLASANTVVKLGPVTMLSHNFQS